MKPLLRFVAAAMMALTLLGCGGLDYLLSKTFAVFQPPPKTTPLYSLEGQRIVLLVDVANQDLAERRPVLTYKVAKALAAELNRERAAASIVSPRDLVTYAQKEPDFARKSAVEIGRQFQADLVLHVIIQGYGLQAAAGVDSFNGAAEVGIRVIDVEAARQAFPDMQQLHLVAVRSATGIQADGLMQAEKAVLDALALKIGQVFVAYEIEALPRKAQVK
jgi:hypothetical protein